MLAKKRPTIRFFLSFVLAVLVQPAASETIQLESEHGIYMVPVRINEEITIPFLLDTGASEVAIPDDVFRTLLRTGTVKVSDLIGTGTYTLADGSKQSSTRLILHEIKVGDQVITEVIANVVPMEGDPLLGQSFLSKLPAWTIDNERHTLVLRDKAGPPDNQQATVGIPTPGQSPEPPPRVPPVVLISPQARQLPYLYQRLDNPTYKTAFDALFETSTDLAPWLKRYLENANGVDTPGEIIQTGEQQFEFYGLCQRHNCDRSFIHIIFLSGGKKAWAFFTSDIGHYRSFGRSHHPSREETAAFDYLRRSAHTVWPGCATRQSKSQPFDPLDLAYEEIAARESGGCDTALNINAE
jgi:clan AA aspartic protease (TIGR02281 family)